MKGSSSAIRDDPGLLAARAATLKVAEAVVELIATPGRAEALGAPGWCGSASG
jgi:hypothetical protein